MNKRTVLCEGCAKPMQITVEPSEQGGYPFHLAQAWCRDPECVAKRKARTRDAAEHADG